MDWRRDASNVAKFAALFSAGTVFAFVAQRRQPVSVSAGTAFSTPAWLRRPSCSTAGNGEVTEATNKTTDLLKIHRPHKIVIPKQYTVNCAVHLHALVLRCCQRRTQGAKTFSTWYFALPTSYLNEKTRRDLLLRPDLPIICTHKHIHTRVRVPIAIEGKMV